MGDSTYLCHLRDTAVTAACSVFLSHATHEGESSTVDQYDHLDEAALQATVAAVEALESSRVFALSLKEKLPRSCCALPEELLSEGRLSSPRLNSAAPSRPCSSGAVP